MAKSAQEIYDEIYLHVKQEGGRFSTWYAGITANIKQRLHIEHGVPEKDHWFIWCEANSEDSARKIEEALLKLGMDGGTGGGDNNSCFVYCYKKTAITEP